MEKGETAWESRSERDQALGREGWQRRFVGGPPRLNEQVELYRSLGYEVRLEHLAGEEIREECGDCILALTVFRVVYTRKLP